MVNIQRWMFLILIALAAIVSCIRSPFAPAAIDSPQSDIYARTAIATESAAGRSNLLYQTGTTVVYTYHSDPADMESAQLCLRRDGEAPVFLAQTGDQVRWFINAVALEGESKVVFAQYLRAEDLAEVWIIGFEGEAARRLLATDDFTALGQGYARAIPRQMLAVPGGDVLLSTTEFGYPAKPLDDLYLLDTSSGFLTQLLAPGQAGKLIVLPSSSQILIENPQQMLMLDVHTLQISPAGSDLFDQAAASSEEPEKPPDDWLVDCSP